MAYRRCISVRAALFARRPSLSFGYLSRENDHNKPEEFCPSRSKIEEYLTQRGSLGSNVKSGSWRYCGLFFRGGSGLAGVGLCMNRYISTSTRDVATVLTDVPTEVVASQVPELSEVAIAAADSAFPVAALQYLIDGFHSFTGLNWWASIALTTVLFHGATIPFLIYESKTIAELHLTKPPSKEVQEKLRVASQDPSAHDKTMSRREAIHKKCADTLYMTRLIHAAIFLDFYFAITNMAEKVPSFKNGGAFWFTDLTTPDATCVLPVLTILAYLASRVMKYFMTPLPSNRVLLANTELLTKQVVRDVRGVLVWGAILTTVNLPQAIYCHWIASYMFWCCYAYCIHLPGVKKALGFPEKARYPGK